MSKQCCRLKFNPVKSIKNIIDSKGQTVSEETYYNRINTCNNCEHLNKTLNQCNICLCFIKLKAKFSAEECPIKKWQKETET